MSFEEIESDLPNVNPHELMNQLSFCVFDLETTGGNQSYDKIIEIGLVKIQNLKIVKELNYLINPEIPIPDFIQKLTSIRTEDIKKCQRIEDIIHEILDFMGDSILVAHNSSFDVPFFNSVLSRLKLETLQNKVICTNLMTKYLIPNIMNSNLAYMSSIFGIPHEKAHRALEDARAAANLLITYLKFFIEKDIRKVNQLYYPRNKFELDRCHFRPQDPVKSIESSLVNSTSPLVVSFKGDKGVLLALVPLENPAKESPFIIDLVKELPWHLITIKMIGPFFEGLLELNLQYTKLAKDIQEKTLNHLISSHFGEEKLLDSDQVLKDKDFLIVHHLIPEQFVIYPLMNLMGKNELVFRFPGHKKKLLQYVVNQTRRFESINQKVRKSVIINQLWKFYLNYINKLSTVNLTSSIIVSRNSFKKNTDDILNQFEDFTLKNPNPFGYPQKHV